MYTVPFEHELTATPYSNTTDLNKVLPFSFDELRILTEAFLSAEQLADAIVPGEEAYVQLRQFDTFGELLSKALNGNTTTPLGNCPRTAIAEVLQYDIVQTFRERGDQSSTYPTEILLQYKISQAQAKIATTQNLQEMYTQKTLTFESRRNTAMRETAELEARISACRKLSLQDH